MNYVMKPSLQHLAFVKVAATLWNQDDVKNLLVEFNISYNYTVFKSSWVKIEAIAVGKVAKLPLPKHIKEKLQCFIRPIGFQISKWWQFHDRGDNLEVNLPNEFFWMPQGMIDKKKTAEVMIKDESIAISTRYKLACIYCLEDGIPKLWEKMTEDCRKSFYNQEDPMNVMQKELVVLWTYQIKGEVDKMNRMIEERMDRRCSPHQYAFEIAAIDGNRVATEYFLQRLTSTEREESLVETAMSVAYARYDTSKKDTEFLKETYSEVLCFLLSVLDDEQLVEVLKSHPWAVLLCFLDRPLQSFFMDTANCMWNFLDEVIYSDLLLRINHSILQGDKDFDYRKLFGDFWQQSPNEYKRYVLNVNEDIIHHMLSHLCSDKDLNNVKLILQDATPEEKEEIIYDDDMQDICEKLMNSKDSLVSWSLLKYIIKECLPLKDEVVAFKENCENGDVWRVSELQRSNEQWKKFLSMLDEIICEFKKRNCEEGECSKAKRLCTEDCAEK